MNRIATVWRNFIHGRALADAENFRLRETNLALEAELAELRKDNRLLVNAQLKQAGAVSLPDLAPEPLPINRVRRMSLHQQQREHAFQTDPRRTQEVKKNG